MSWSLYDWERSTWDSSQETKITTCINTHTWCKLECNPQRGQKWKRTKDLGLDFLEAPPTTTHHQKRQKEKVSFCVYSAFSSDVTSRKHSCPEIWMIAPSYRLSLALSYGLIPYLPLSLVCEHTMVRHLPLHIIRTQKNVCGKDGHHRAWAEYRMQIQNFFPKHFPHFHWLCELKAWRRQNEKLQE